MQSFTQAEQSAVNTALHYTIKKLTAQLEATKEIANNVTWKKLPFAPNGQRAGLTGKTGVYKIIHMPTGQVMYIGQGVVAQRRNIHNRVFNNNGETVVYKDVRGNVTSSVDSPAGRKMFAFDSNIKNWEFHACIAPKHVAQQIEEKLQSLYQPVFCDPKMSGIC